MKNAKKLGIAIVQVVIAGILVFIAIQHYAGSSATDESLTDSTIKSELENNDLHANAGGSGEISLEETEDGSFKDPAINHQDENNTSENNITSEPVINGHGTETTENQVPHKERYVDVDADDEGDFESYEADLPTEEQSAEAWGYVAENNAVLH